MITVLAGGVGAARLLRGIVQVVDPATVTAIVNTGDDLRLHGLAISPDLDTITYTLAGAINPTLGWGLDGETWSAMDALERFAPVRPAGSGAGATWFRLGDRDLATHLYRTHRLDEGATLTEVTAEITRAWNLALRLLPMTDQPVATRVEVVDEGEISFQEYFVGRRHSVPVRAVRFEGIDAARASEAALAALEHADTIVVAPSNPIVSIGPILALAELRGALEARRDDVVAVSPIIAGAALKGPADRMLTELGHEASVVGVARLYAPFTRVLVIDNADADQRDAVAAEGVEVVVTDTVMSSAEKAAALADAVLRAVAR
jgi:LPPG:FO 2-phospho-L-lactate transferase